MVYSSVAADPFSILTVVVAPAVLTNASSVLALGTNNRLARVADRSHAVTAQLAKLEPGAREHELWAAEFATLQTRAQLAATSASLLLFGFRTVRQFGSHLDRRFYRGVLRPAIGIPGKVGTPSRLRIGRSTKRGRNHRAHRCGEEFEESRPGAIREDWTADSKAASAHIGDEKSDCSRVRRRMIPLGVGVNRSGLPKMLERTLQVPEGGHRPSFLW